MASADPGGAARLTARRGFLHSGIPIYIYITHLFDSYSLHYYSQGEHMYTSPGLGGHSEVDILVATPGRYAYNIISVCVSTATDS